MAKKTAALRIFRDENDKMNLSVRDCAGEAIVVSQFTLCADTRKGNRPSFIGAAAPEIAAPLVDLFAESMREQGVPTQQGLFGADMKVELLNDGPVTILLEN
jgi:D-tyrosyl-tRNA(Tyr) deacylase